MSRIISNNAVKDAKIWQIPDMDGSSEMAMVDYSAGLGGICEQLPTLKDIESIKQNAYDAGFKEGYADGMEIAKEEFDKSSAVARNILRDLSSLASQVDDRVKTELLETVLMVSREIMKTEISLNPEKILPSLNAAISTLPVTNTRIKIISNPEDAETIKKFLLSNDSESNQQLSLVEDQSITRGGCRIITENSSVDATIENRISKIAAALLSDNASPAV